MGRNVVPAVGVFLAIICVSVLLVYWCRSYPEEHRDVPDSIYSMNWQVPPELEEAYRQQDNGDDVGKWLEEHGLLSIKPHLEASGEFM